MHYANNNSIQVATSTSLKKSFSHKFTNFQKLTLLSHVSLQELIDDKCCEWNLVHVSKIV